MRKSFLQVDENDDPTLLVAPGIMRDALAYMLSNFHSGDFPVWQLSPKMNKWAGQCRDRLGHEFAQLVAAKLSENGWHTETEVAVTKLLRKRFDLDYGDVDVLAWRDDSARVLLIECKDVQQKKAEGEIAEQLADFRGELRDNGKPDLLLRHLRRIDVIFQHQDEVVAYASLQKPHAIEGHLVFKKPVPMKFAWERMKDRIALSLMSELDRI